MSKVGGGGYILISLRRILIVVHSKSGSSASVMN